MNFIDPRHKSYLYSKAIFNDNINQVINYINQQSLVLANQRLNGTVEIRQLVLLAQSYFELKSIDGFKMSMDLYKEAMDILSLTPFSSRQVDYAYILACHAVSYHSSLYIVNSYRKLREPKDVYDQIDVALFILNEIQYTGPLIGVILNMYAFCCLQGQNAMDMQYQQSDVNYLKELVATSLSNLKRNGLSDTNSDIADCYCLLGSLNIFTKDKKNARSYLLKSIEIYSQIYNPLSHPKIAYAYCKILTTLFDHRDEHIGLKAIAMKRAYYGQNHFEVIEPLYSTYICLLKNNCYNISVETDLNNIQKLNGLKTNSQQIWNDTKCCQIL